MYKPLRRDTLTQIYRRLDTLYTFFFGIHHHRKAYTDTLIIHIGKLNKLRNVFAITHIYFSIIRHQLSSLFHFFPLSHPSTYKYYTKKVEK